MKKKYISFLLKIQTLSKDAQEQFPRPFLPVEALMICALQPHFGNSLLHRSAENNDTQDYPMLLEALCVLLTAL